MSSTWIVLLALLGSWILVAAVLGALIARWMRMQRGDGQSRRSMSSSAPAQQHRQ